MIIVFFVSVLGLLLISTVTITIATTTVKTSCADEESENAESKKVMTATMQSGEGMWRREGRKEEGRARAM